MWRNAREKEVEMLAVVLSDVIIFLQENDKKYSFFSQDSKVRLNNLRIPEGLWECCVTNDRQCFRLASFHWPV